MYIGLRVKYLLYFTDFNEIWIFFNTFSKNIQMKNLMIICPVGAELLHADRRTGRQTDVQT